MSLIDLHTHTRHGSVCGYMWSDELVERAKSIGLDGVCITEHDSFWSSERIRRLAEKHEFPVIGGAEITSDCGDVLVFGLDKLPLNVSSIREIRKRVDDAGGVMIAAHPFRGLAASAGIREITTALVDRLVESPLVQHVHELEVLNGASGAWERRLARAVAGRTGRIGTGGSDAHGIMMVGACYTRFENEISSEETLVQALRDGRFTAADNLVYRQPLAKQPVTDRTESRM